MCIRDRNYTALTGRPALPPAWTVGLWLTTSFTTSYDEKTVTSFVDGMAERRIPLQIFSFLSFFIRESMPGTSSNMALSQSKLHHSFSFIQ